MRTDYRIVLLIIFLAGTFAQAKTPAKKIKIITATSQAFAGGAAGSRSGVTYRIMFITPASNNLLQVDKLWISDEYYDVSAYHYTSGSASFNKNDTLIIIAKKYLPQYLLMENQKQEQAIKTVAPPFEFKEDALLGYTCGKKRKYLRISKLEQLPKENRP